MCGIYEGCSFYIYHHLFRFSFNRKAIIRFAVFQLVLYLICLDNFHGDLDDALQIMPEIQHRFIIHIM